jgi:hypothetical protein
MAKIKMMVVWIAVLALLAGSGRSFAQGALVGKKMFPNSTTYSLPGLPTRPASAWT